ncbi:MAG: hypothetical protein EPN22_16850 [Nitrospirae bacterium]|nr:MAG: hypothetical protein EPN22_16850 [Nitrospirota bacterium]
MRRVTAVDLAQGVIDNCRISGSTASLDGVKDERVLIAMARLCGIESIVAGENIKDAVRTAIAQKYNIKEG